MPATTTAPAPSNIPPATGFDKNTRQSYMLLNTMPYVANSTQQQQVTQVGFLARIITNISFTITTASTGTYANKIPAVASAGTAGIDLPTPFNIVNRLILRSNEGTDIYSTSGYGNYLLNLFKRTSFDQRNPDAGFNTTNSATMPFTLPATYTTSTAYTIRFTLDLPISINEANQYGLVLIQNPTTRLSYQIQWNSIELNLLTMGGTTPSITVSNFSCTPVMIFYNLPVARYNGDTGNFPDLSLAHLVIEDQITIQQNGQFVYRPPIGNALCLIIQQLINNGVAMNPTTDWINHQIIYQATQNVYTIPPAHMEYINMARRGGIPLPDGVVAWDFMYGSGVLERYSARDTINLARLTDFQVITNISGTTTITGTNYSLNVREMLAPSGN